MGYRDMPDTKEIAEPQGHVAPEDREGYQQCSSQLIEALNLICLSSPICCFVLPINMRAALQIDLSSHLSIAAAMQTSNSRSHTSSNICQTLVNKHHRGSICLKRSPRAANHLLCV